MFFDNYSTITKKKTMLKNEKSRAEFLFLILSAVFWYASYFYSLKTDWALFFLMNLILEKQKAEKNALKVLTMRTYELMNRDFFFSNLKFWKKFGRLEFQFFRQKCIC